MKRLLLLSMVLFPSLLLAEQFSAQPQGLLGPERTLVSAWFFNEGAGVVANDPAIGNPAKLRNHGDLLSGPTWVTGLHGHALDFSATNSRVEIQNENEFDFITMNSTWTLVVVYKAKALLKGIIFSKTGTFNSTQGFYIQAESDATGDIAFVRILSGATQKWVTGVVPLNQCCRDVWRVLIIDYCQTGTLTGDTVRIYIDGKRRDTTGIPTIGDITNDFLAVISGWDNGTSTSFNGVMDMVAVYRGDSKGPITEDEARAITARILGW